MQWINDEEVHSFVGCSGSCREGNQRQFSSAFASKTSMASSTWRSLKLLGGMLLIFVSVLAQSSGQPQHSICGSQEQSLPAMDILDSSSWSHGGHQA